MTKITHLCLIALLLVFANSTAKINTTANSTVSNYMYSNIQRVRIDFTMPDGYVRHLLLAFTKDNSATDNYDHGYDGINKDAYPYDLNWMIGDLRCVIQGVGAFDNLKKYPLGMFMSNDGNIEIALDTLENFDSPIDVFIYDALLNSYTHINDSNYAAHVEKGDHLDRFYIAFKDQSTFSASTTNTIAAKSLSTNDHDLKNTRISYLKNTKELYIDTYNAFSVKNIKIYNLNGQNIFTVEKLNSKLIKIPLHNLHENYAIVSIETEQGILNRTILMK